MASPVQPKTIKPIALPSSGRNKLHLTGNRMLNAAVNLMLLGREAPMPPRLTLILLCAALASCGAKNNGSGQAREGSVMNSTSLPKLTLSSNAFADGQAIPARYTCDGADEVPQLHWGEPPPGTKSFALVIDDPDAPSGTFRHWGVYDIPGSTRAIGGGARVGSEAVNDFGKSGYGGPCPPKGHGAHHYHFRLFAISVDRLGLKPGAKVADVERAAQQNAIAQGELIGIYERK